MTPADWLDAALRDAEQRGLPQLRPLLQNLARATVALRAADWNVAPGVPASPRKEKQP